MQSQNFNIVATHAVNGDVVFVQDQLTRARDTASPAHTRMGLKLGHRGLAVEFLHVSGKGCVVAVGQNQLEALGHTGHQRSHQSQLACIAVVLVDLNGKHAVVGKKKPTG